MKGQNVNKEQLSLSYKLNPLPNETVNDFIIPVIIPLSRLPISIRSISELSMHDEVYERLSEYGEFSDKVLGDSDASYGKVKTVSQSEITSHRRQSKWTIPA